MEPSNDHERIIATFVDEAFRKDPANRRHTIRLDIAGSLDFVISPSESRFLVRYIRWRLSDPIGPADSG